MFKKILFVIIALFTVSVASGKTLLIVGDSISAGYGVDLSKGWVKLLEQRLKDKHYDYEVINASISGDVTSNGAARLPALLEKYHPAVVIIEMGGNDGLRGTPPKLIQQNLTQMVQQAKQQSKVLLVGIQLPPNYGELYLERFSAMYPAIANEQQVVLLDSIVKNTGGNADLMQSDGIHPNEAGQPIILNDIWEKLVPLLDKPNKS